MQAMGLLAGGVAHDFNNILTSIILTADTQLLKGNIKNREGVDALQSIKEAAARASILTRQLLTFGRRRVSQPRTLDLADVIRSIRPILENALGEDIDFQVHLAPDLWPVHIDPAQVEQVLNNLCFNARDAMPKG